MSSNTSLTNGTLDVRLKDYADEYEQMAVVAVDYAGNKSKTVQVKNPYEPVDPNRLNWHYRISKKSKVFALKVW